MPTLNSYFVLYTDGAPPRSPIHRDFRLTRLDIVPLPPTFSYSSYSTYEACPMRYAFAYVYRIPEPSRPVGALTFGSTAHEAFEAFTKDRRERLARGEEPPTRDDLERLFRERWGEQFIGAGAIGLALFVIVLVASIPLGMLAVAVPPVGIPLAVLVLLAIVAAGSACQGVFNAALYRYAVGGQAAGVFRREDLDAAFRPRRGTADDRPPTPPMPPPPAP